MKDYRKWSVAVLTLLLGAVLGFMGKLTSDFAMIASVVNGAFMGANAIGDHRALRREP